MVSSQNHLAQLTTLAAVVADGLAFAPEYRGGLSNHYPMTARAITVLERRGLVGSDTLLRYTNRYRARLERPLPYDPAVDLAALLPDERRSQRGDFSLFNDWAAYYAARLATQDWRAVVAEAFAMHGDGAAVAVAGHAVIRIGALLDAAAAWGDSDVFRRELSQGLGYLAARTLPLRGEAEDVAPDLPFAEALTQVFRVAPRPAFGLIFLRARSIAREPRFLALARRTQPPTTWLEAARLLAEIAVSSPKFGLLHTITTAHALAIIEREVPEAITAAVRTSYVDFALTTLMMEGLRHTGVQASIPADATPQRLAEILAPTLDEHALKAAWSCVELHAISGDPVFLAAGCRLAAAFGAP